MSRSLGSISGLTNLGVNLAYRFFSQADSENYYDMSVAIEAGEVETAGTSMGKFLASLLMADVPESTE